MKDYTQIAELFKALASPIRIQIIRALGNTEMCVSDLLEVIPTSQPNISQHLSSLEAIGILTKRRDGVKIFYKVYDHQLAIICDWICARV